MRLGVFRVVWPCTKHQFVVASHDTPTGEPGLQLRHVPWLGIKPVTFWFTGRHSNHWATAAKGGKWWWLWWRGVVVGKWRQQYLNNNKQMWKDSLGWCVSVECALDCESEGCWFVFQSGHVPGLPARFPCAGHWCMQEATTHWCFLPSLSPSLPLSLKINK